MPLTSRMIIVVLLLAPALSAAADEKKPKTGSQLMGGEKVLPVDEGPLLNPLRRFDNFPWFEISNLRPGRTLRDALEMDYASEGPLMVPIHIVVLTNGKRLRFPVNREMIAAKQGTIICNYDAVDDKSPLGADMEVYVELTDAEPMFDSSSPRSRSSQPKPEPKDALYFKVSKSAVRGKVEALTFARELRETEQRIYDARQKKYGLPPPPPEGSVLIPTTPPLVPGVPVLAAFEGDWLKAEVIDVQTLGTGRGASTTYIVYWPKFGHAGNKMMSGKTHLAIQKDILEKLQKDPKSFSPSAEIPFGALQPLPPGYEYVVLPATVKLLPGTPVSWGGSSWAYLVVADGQEQITVISDPPGFREQTAPRRQFIIHKDILKQLSEPDAEQKFAAKLKESKDKAKAKNRSSIATRPSLPSSFPSRTYPINAEIPDGYVRVNKETPLEVDTELKIHWGRGWNSATVVKMRDNGDPEIHWEGWNTVEPVTRDSLIISKKTLELLNNKSNSGKSAKPDSADTKRSDSSETKIEKKAPEKKGANSTDKFKLVLESAGKKKISVVKLIMEITDLDLASAREVADDLPIDLKSNLSKADAERWKKKLEDAGAKAKLEAVQVKP